MSNRSSDHDRLAQQVRRCHDALQRDCGELSFRIEGLGAGIQQPFTVGQDDAEAEDMTVDVEFDDDRFEIVDDEIRLKIGEERAFEEAFWIFVTATGYAPGGDTVTEVIAVTPFDADWLCQRGVAAHQPITVPQSFRVAAEAGSDNQIRIRADAARPQAQEGWSISVSMPVVVSDAAIVPTDVSSQGLADSR